MAFTLTLIKINLKKLPNFNRADLGEDFIQEDIAHAISCQSKENLQQKGMDGRYIMGFVKDPKAPLNSDNFKGNTAFRQMIFAIAQHNKDPKLKEMLEKNAGKTIVMTDQRSAKKIELKDPSSKQEVIGVYKLNEQGEVEFQPNGGYALVSKFGLAQATPGIRTAILQQASAAPPQQENESA